MTVFIAIRSEVFLSALKVCTFQTINLNNLITHLSNHNLISFDKRQLQLHYTHFCFKYY